MISDTMIVSRSSGSASRFDPGHNLDTGADDVTVGVEVLPGQGKKSFSGDAVAFAVRDAYSGVGNIYPQPRRTTASNMGALRHFYGPTWK